MVCFIKNRNFSEKIQKSEEKLRIYLKSYRFIKQTIKKIQFKADKIDKGEVN